MSEGVTIPTPPLDEDVSGEVPVDENTPVQPSVTPASSNPPRQIPHDRSRRVFDDGTLGPASAEELERLDDLVTPGSSPKQ